MFLESYNGKLYNIFVMSFLKVYILMIIFVLFHVLEIVIMHVSNGILEFF